MSEQTQVWQYIKDRLPLVHMERITEKLNAGVPDVAWVHAPSGASGWMELKYLHRRLPNTCLPWNSKEQPLWLGRWARKGGRASVLCRVRDEWYWWRAEGTVEWVRWIQTSAVWDSPTLRLGSWDGEQVVQRMLLTH